MSHPQLSAIRTNLNAVESYLASITFPPNTEQLFGFAITDCSVSIVVHLSYAPDDAGHDRLLALAGDLFGREGWLATFDPYTNKYNWKKKVNDHITICMYGAQKANVPEAYPVPPNAFPLMLGENSEASE